VSAATTRTTLLDVVLELPAVVVVGVLAALAVAVLILGTVQRKTGDLAFDEV
jgi:hypothetical protein